MWESKKAKALREAEKEATDRANESARSALPRSVGTTGLNQEQFERASSVLSARTILGDVTTEEILETAEYIFDGTRYDPNDDDDEDDDFPPSFTFDEGKSLADWQLGIYARGASFPPVGQAGSEFRQYEDSLAKKVRDRQEAMRPAWEQLLRTAGEEIQASARTPRYVFNYPKKSGKTAAIDSAAATYLAEDAVRNTPHSAPLLFGEHTPRVETTPLVPLDADEQARLDKLREASQVYWGDVAHRNPDYQIPDDLTLLPRYAGSDDRAAERERLTNWTPTGVPVKDQDPPIDEDFDNSVTVVDEDEERRD